LVIHAEDWDEFVKTRGTLRDFIRHLSPSWLRLSGEQLEQLGYEAVDPYTEEVLLFVPPTQLAHGAGSSPVSDEGGGPAVGSGSPP
jgi:hypothetical protein